MFAVEYEIFAHLFIPKKSSILKDVWVWSSAFIFSKWNHRWHHLARSSNILPAMYFVYFFFFSSVWQGESRPELRLHRRRVEGRRHVPYEVRHPRRARGILLMHRWSVQLRRESPHAVLTATGVPPDRRSGDTKSAIVVLVRAASYLSLNSLNISA